MSLLSSLSLAGAVLLGVTAGSAPASAATASGGSAPSPIQYTTSTQPLQALGTVDFGTLAGTTPSNAAHSSANGQRSSAAAQRLGRPPLAGSGTKKSISPGSFSIQKGNVAGEIGFPGVTGPEQAAANPPGQSGPADVEPPDQGACAGPDASGQPIVFDFVNDAVAAYSTTGTQEMAVTPAYALFAQPSTAFMSDPRCYYDAPTHRWFFAMFDVGNPAPSTQFLAVSTSADPLGTYEVFAYDTTDANNPLGDCPCFGDYDQIGADANGFYVTTNEFSNLPNFPAPGYNGTDIWALPKQGLEAAASGTGSVPAITRYAVTGDAFGASTATVGNGPYHLSPAATPPGGTYAPDTEYFTESNSDLLADNHLIVYALHGTGLLASGGTPTLAATELTSEPYAFPPNATQKPGPLPLGNSDGFTAIPTLEADFNAVQQTTYTDGQLYGELDTAIGATSSSPGVDGIDWFSLAPSASGSTVSASIVKQGYVANSQNLLYPDLILDGSGHGYLDFSASGSAEYPSAEYVAFHTQPTGPIHVAASGAAPEDGFSCYPPFSTPAAGCRWGDYSGGAVWGGRAYMLAEYIPPTPRDTNTNWGTFVWSAPVH